MLKISPPIPDFVGTGAFMTDGPEGPKVKVASFNTTVAPGDNVMLLTSTKGCDTGV